MGWDCKCPSANEFTAFLLVPSMNITRTYNSIKSHQNFAVHEGWIMSFLTVTVKQKIEGLFSHLLSRDGLGPKHRATNTWKIPGYVVRHQLVLNRRRKRKEKKTNGICAWSFNGRCLWEVALWLRFRKRPSVIANQHVVHRCIYFWLQIRSALFFPYKLPAPVWI